MGERESKVGGLFRNKLNITGVKCYGEQRTVQTILPREIKVQGRLLTPLTEAVEVSETRNVPVEKRRGVEAEVIQGLGLGQEKEIGLVIVKVEDADQGQNHPTLKEEAEDARTETEVDPKEKTALGQVLDPTKDRRDLDQEHALQESTRKNIAKYLKKVNCEVDWYT